MRLGTWESQDVSDLPTITRANCIWLKYFVLFRLYCCRHPTATPKALRTSAHPGLTRALSTRLRLTSNADAEAGLPRVYAFDTPGVMLPFMGKGDLGAERGIK